MNRSPYLIGEEVLVTLGFPEYVGGKDARGVIVHIVGNEYFIDTEMDGEVVTGVENLSKIRENFVMCKPFVYERPSKYL